MQILCSQFTVAEEKRKPGCALDQIPLTKHGRFEHFGQSYRYKVERFDTDRHIFWVPGGFSFQIASWDWPVAADWCWNCDSDDFVVYEDPDHDGWYLLYNIHTGGYVHVMYMGS